MEPFKNLLNPALVQASAVHLQRAWPDFDSRGFVARACSELQTLEMKARAMQICAALQATLPADFEQAAAIVEAALAPAEPGVAMADLKLADSGLRGWVLWPVGEFIARQGLNQPERALAALHALTQRFTAEFAIRPFIVEHPELAFATLQRWCSDDSAHVRRLVSEGSRPRLPWGLQLKALIADPSPTLPLLLALQDDPSEYVRRSVANHLNDIAKDHPMRVVQWVQQHLSGASGERRALLQRASRSLIKAGHGQMLRAWQLAEALHGQATLQIAPAQVVLGQSTVLTLRLRSTASRAQRLLIDYAVHHVKANGRTSPKVFKGWTVELPARAELTLVKSHSLRPITTRRYYAGRHGVSVHINGQVVCESGFELALG
jgi:3-methyladenine DNA glycosylase AlkC